MERHNKGISRQSIKELKTMTDAERVKALLPELKSLTAQVIRKYGSRKDAELAPLLVQLQYLADRVTEKYSKAQAPAPADPYKAMLKDMRKQEGKNSYFVGTFYF